jgi:hypothetical protein
VVNLGRTAITGGRTPRGSGARASRGRSLRFLSGRRSSPAPIRLFSANLPHTPGDRLAGPQSARPWVRRPHDRWRSAGFLSVPPNSVAKYARTPARPWRRGNSAGALFPGVPGISSAANLQAPERSASPRFGEPSGDCLSARVRRARPCESRASASADWSFAFNLGGFFNGRCKPARRGLFQCNR